jgi:hypothetical protein
MALHDKGNKPMSGDDATRAKLAGLRGAISDRLEDARARYFDPPTVLEYFQVYNRAAAVLRKAFPNLLGDVPDRPIPEPSNTTDFGGRGYIERRHLERVRRDIDYVLEVLDYSLPRGEPESAGEPRSAATAAIDVRDLSLADVFHAVTRLKLSSLAFLIGLVIAVAGALAAFVRAQYEPMIAKQEAFANSFAVQFANRETLRKLVPAVLEEKPDGISTYKEALGSLLWQVKSQDGFAEFLSGPRKTSLQIRFDGESIALDWGHGTNPLMQILSNVGLEPTEERLAQLNADLNLLGAAWLDGSNHLVRGRDGGLVLVGEEP